MPKSFDSSICAHRDLPAYIQEKLWQLPFLYNCSVSVSCGAKKLAILVADAVVNTVTADFWSSKIKTRSCGIQF